MRRTALKLGLSIVAKIRAVFSPTKLMMSERAFMNIQREFRQQSILAALKNTFLLFRLINVLWFSLFSAVMLV